MVPGAHRSPPLTEAAFHRPLVGAACPVTVRTDYWTTDRAGTAVVAYLEHHLGAHVRFDATGTITDPRGVTTRAVVLRPQQAGTGTPTDHHHPWQLVYTIAPSGSGTGIRLDAWAPPPGTPCVRTGTAVRAG